MLLKTILTLFVMSSSLSLFARGNQNAIRKANDLISSLEKLSRQAARVERRAEDNGRDRRAAKFRKVKNISRRMANRVQRIVIDNLEDGLAMHQVKNRFQRLKREGGLYRLDTALNNINRMPPRMTDTVEVYTSNKRAVSRALSSPTNASRRKAVRLSKNVVSTLREINRVAVRVERRAENNSRTRRARKFRRVKRISNNLVNSVTNNITKALQDRVNIRRINSDYRNMLENGGFSNLDRAFENIARMPAQLVDLKEELRTRKRSLQRELRAISGANNSAKWKGRCSVVLENIFGSDIRRYVGRSTAATQRHAVEFAKRNALNQCNSAKNNNAALHMQSPFGSFSFLKCTVTSQCRATRI